MKVLLYEEMANSMKKSGIGRALRHQKKALELVGVESTFDPKDNYDLVHVNSSFAKSYRFVKTLKKKGVPVVVHGHSTYEDFRESFRCWKLIEPWFDNNLTKIYGEAPLIITPTPYSKKLIENYKCTKCPVLAISNGIVLEDYAYDEKIVKKYKDFFNIKPNQKVVIGIGLLFKRKGLDDFFEIAKRMPNVTFIWFGHLNSLLVPSYINKLIRNRPKNVLMPGYIDGAVIKGALMAADAMFFPSREETEGIVVLEALAAKTPLLIRDIPVYEDWLEDGVSCYKGNNLDEFESKLKTILSVDNSEIVNNGYKIACQRTLDKVGKQLLEAYNKVIEITKAGKN